MSLFFPLSVGKGRESWWAKTDKNKKNPEKPTGKKEEGEIREDIAGGYLITGISQLGKGERQAVLGEKK